MIVTATGQRDRFIGGHVLLKTRALQQHMAPQGCSDQ